MKISGQLVDIHNREIYPAEVTLNGMSIGKVKRVSVAPDRFLLPGLIDSHVHIESSMITPGAFGHEVVKHGTTGIVADPHEIANVMGKEGIDFMIEDAGKSPVRFWFGAPSCVPATEFETSGASLGYKDIELLLDRSEIRFLSEVMNFPAVISGKHDIMMKIEAAKRKGKRIDGHAPGLSGVDLKKYVSTGITTDHECTNIGEAREKISLGMKIQIREGSAAGNLDELKELITTDPGMVMLCSDDLHPEMLAERHINKLVARLIKEGFDIFDVIRCATFNPVKHYNLEAGLLKEGDSADFIVVDSLKEMNVQETWIRGEKVYDNGQRSFQYTQGSAINKFNCSTVKASQILCRAKGDRMRVIEAYDGELVTGDLHLPVKEGDIVNADIANDILKIIVKDRYNDSPPATGFIKGFGLKKGAFAGSVAHDSHNIVAVGTNDNDITVAVNEIVRNKGGLAVSDHGVVKSLKLEIAGIMTARYCEEVSREYTSLTSLVKSMGCTMQSPFMTLSFMALLVIPSLKIGDKGLFDVGKFTPVALFE